MWNFSVQIHILSAKFHAKKQMSDACEHCQAWLAETEVEGPSRPGELSSVFEAVFAKMDEKLIHWLKGKQI